MNEPIFFEPNRVSRVYQGGALFSALFGGSAEDGGCPEEWIASPVEALNAKPARPREGVSRQRGTGIYFDQMIAQDPEGMLGKRRQVLVKVLDSAIRLPVQAHPDPAFSRRHFKSEYGKAECWLILATRPGAKIYYGFRPGVTRAQFSEAVERSETNKESMTSFLNERPVHPGEVYFIPPRTVHAIGAGCLILEIQEPTDFTIQPEYWCGDYKLTAREMYLGLDKQTALDCFDFTPSQAVNKEPVLDRAADGAVYETLIGRRETTCFSVRRIRLSGGSFRLEEGGGVYVVTEGTGALECGERQWRIKKGDAFFLPARAVAQMVLTGSLEAVECLGGDDAAKNREKHQFGETR